MTGNGWIDPGKLTREEAEDFFAALYRGKSHIPDAVREDGGGSFSVAHFGALASFDYDELTRLVFLAHERAVRAWVKPSRPRRVRICVAKRLRGGADMSNAHPTIDEALAKFRAHDNVPWWRVLTQASLR